MTFYEVYSMYNDCLWNTAFLFVLILVIKVHQD